MSEAIFNDVFRAAAWTIHKIQVFWHGKSTIIARLSLLCNTTDFRYEDKQQGKGLISAPLPEFPRSGKQAFYFRKGKTDPWMEIGQLSRPDGKTEYICKYYVTLDDRGILRLHAGEVPYWTSDRAEVLKEQEGCVFRAELELQPNDLDEKRDPFCGKH